jgi:DNA-directed RNA polymerase specialized sigma54-like protein
MWQLNLQASEPLIREIGAAIVGNIDDDRCLVASVGEIGPAGDIAEVERALDHVQHFDRRRRRPSGALLLQIRTWAASAAETLVRIAASLQNQRIPELAKQSASSPKRSRRTSVHQAPRLRSRAATADRIAYGGLQTSYLSNRRGLSRGAE